LPVAGSNDLALTGAVGDYELLGEIARGGMGIVYRARERHSGRVIAFKMMLPAGSTTDLRRFHLEARATGELNHPGIVAIHAWGEHEGRPYYTMDFVPGVPLNHLIQKGALPSDRAVRYLLGIARAVGAAHTLNIVHRDLKPGNVIIDLSDQPRVLDFGLAKRHRTDALPESQPADPAVQPPTPAPLPGQALSSRTEIGAILGTPSYMAPEQVRAEHEQVGPPADVHALGAIFYEMLTGRPPYLADTTYHTLIQVLEQKPMSFALLAPHVPAVLEDFCRRCLDKDARRRYPDANALADDLQRRWNRAVRAARFARLTLTVGFVLVVLLALRFSLLSGPLAVGLQQLAWQASSATVASEPVQLAAPVLVWLLEFALVGLAPCLAQVGLLAWLGAWGWNTCHPWRLVGAWTVPAALATVLSWCSGLEWLAEWPLFLAWLLAANALTALGVLTIRFSRRSEATGYDGNEGAAPAGVPYLQKLFAARADTRPQQSSRVTGLADLELGKALSRWDDHEVYRARQRSLDRPTLVWLIKAAPTEAPPGVVVRHPAILGLHAVGSYPGGWFLVTEPVAASPLEEFVQQRGLEPVEAASLTMQLAHAIQAMHEQGVCHGRLTPQWVLVRGSLEPLLCPCGFPSQALEDRLHDIRALGRMLRNWLPARQRGWNRYLLAPLYRSATTAASGLCNRAADLAADLERAAHLVQLRWRDTWAGLLVLLLLGVPFLLALGQAWLSPVAEQERPDTAVNAAQEAAGAGYRLLALIPAAVILGYSGARMYVHRRRAGGGRHRQTSWLAVLLGEDQLPRLFLLGVFALIASLLTWFTLRSATWMERVEVARLVAAEFVGCWLLGVCLAAIVTYLEVLLRSVRR
jgi:serine/threonine protein kinase